VSIYIDSVVSVFCWLSGGNKTVKETLLAFALFDESFMMFLASIDIVFIKLHICLGHQVVIWS